MNEQITCECCGSSNVVIQESSRMYPIPFANDIEYKNKVIHCNDCGENVEIGSNQTVDEFLSEKNPIYLNEIQKSIRTILDNMDKKGYSQTRIERAFDIPKRTISKWYNHVNTPSAGAISLLRLIMDFPWLINVAENNYDEKSAHTVALGNEIKLFCEELKNRVNLTACCESFSSNSFSLKVDVEEKSTSPIEIDSRKNASDNTRDELLFVKPSSILLAGV